MVEYSRPPTPEEEQDIENVISNIDDLVNSVKPVSDYYGHLPVTPGSKILKPELAPIDTVRETCVLEHKLSNLPVKLFSLAPVYQLCGIGFSLPKEFINSDVTPAGARIVTYEVGFDVFDGMEADQNVIEAIDPENWEAFCTFLSQCGFQRSDGTVYKIGLKEMDVYDKPHDCFFKLNVFTPSTPTEMCIPFSHEGRVRLAITPLVLEGKDGKETD